MKTVETRGERGYDAGKKINGRKRHLLVDTLGLIIVVVVTVASAQDRDGGKLVFASVGDQPRLEKVWADGGYRGAHFFKRKRGLPGPRSTVRGKWRLFCEPSTRKGLWFCLDVGWSSVLLGGSTAVVC